MCSRCAGDGAGDLVAVPRLAVRQAALVSAGRVERRVPRLNARTFRLFALYDADGDGVIQRSEIRDVIVAAYRLSGLQPGTHAFFFRSSALPLLRPRLFVAPTMGPVASLARERSGTEKGQSGPMIGDGESATALDYLERLVPSGAGGQEIRRRRRERDSILKESRRAPLPAPLCRLKGRRRDGVFTAASPGWRWRPCNRTRAIDSSFRVQVARRRRKSCPRPRRTCSCSTRSRSSSSSTGTPTKSSR